jgi:hypothetical protein
MPPNMSYDPNEHSLLKSWKTLILISSQNKTNGEKAGKKMV